MNRLILTILALGISIGCYARTSPNTKSKYPRAEIKVSYHCHDQHLKTDAKAYVAEYQMILLANPTYSKFYNMQCEYIDSLHSTPSGKAKYRKMLDIAARKAVETGNFDAVPAAPSKIYVFKSSSDSTCTVFDTNGSSGNHFYAEALAEMQWQINDSTKNILGYDCIMAQTDYHGRHWTVWFTPDIPIHDGPWKLSGLPGLILEASESSRQHIFTADGIEASDIEIRPVYNTKTYEKVNRVDALEAQRKYLFNGDRMTMAMIQDTPDGSKIEMSDSGRNESPDTHVDFLETDYRH